MWRQRHRARPHGLGGHAVRAGVIMLVGGLIGMALIRPERDARRWTNPIAVAAAGPA
jgi:hypothetical protein